jgi:hypothetical protein
MVVAPTILPVMPGGVHWQDCLRYYKEIRGNPFRITHVLE